VAIAVRTCSAKTKAGRPCANPVVRPSGLCVVHDPESPTAAIFAPGHPPTSPGKPANPKAVEILERMLEEQIETWLAPYWEAVTSAVVTGTYEGKVIASDIADLGARMAATEKVLDRVYGKPTQRTEQQHTGSFDVAAFFGVDPLQPTDSLPEEAS
jgi:hypothetical protein